MGSEKNFNQEDLLDLYIEMNPIFIRSGYLNKISKNYRSMVKLAKRDKRKRLKAQVYFAYGKYLIGIQNDEPEGRKFLSKSLTLFQALNLTQGITEVNKYIEDNLNKTKTEPKENASVIERLIALLSVSKRIKVDMIQELLKLNKETLIKVLIKWGQKYNFELDGDYLNVNKEALPKLIDDLNRNGLGI